ncbi:Tether containing UBX domain for GLUT4 [Trichoplax sp. H2]|nr:Tether containing UBX domain for GLUT4 [Trichoplax sp. H2]|eukprot:RDD39859.1 Tether containing UBX domain for GLUT4 [Trichoplax sp. H2]
MATKSVVILLPNARRKSIKVKTNTTIAEIVDNICLKEKLNSSFYSLRYQRKLLQESITFLHANLPNNVSLELIKLDKPKTDNEITVALQVGDGSRLQHSFPASTSLWDIIQYWENQYSRKNLPSLLTTEANKVISCVYMHQEISGRNALQRTFLRSLGLDSGRAIIRLHYRDGQDEDNRELDSEVERTFNMTNTVSVPSEPSAEEERTTIETSQINVEERFTKVPSNLPAANIEVSGSRITLSHPADDHQLSEITPQEFTSNVVDSDTNSGASHAPDIPLPMETVPAPIESKENSQSDIGEPVNDNPIKKKWVTEGEPDEDVKRRKIDDDNILGKDGNSGDMNKDVDLCPVVYHLDDIEGFEIDSEVYSDDFYDVSVDDIKQMLQGLHYTKSHYSNKDQQILMTKDLRDKRALESAQIYDKAAIRFYFPDKFVIQAFFKVSAKLEYVLRTHSLDTLSDLVTEVEKFVKSTLNDVNMPFYLYTAPPKRILNKKDMRLYQAGLVPKAIIHVGCDTKLDSYLAPQYLDMRVNPNSPGLLRDVDISRKTQASDSGLDAASSKISEKSRADNIKKGVETNEKQQQTRNKDNKDRKVPRWFQIGKNSY